MEKKKRSKKNTKKFDTVVICVIVLCLIVVVGALCFCLTYKNNKNKDSKDGTTVAANSNIDPTYEDGDYAIYEIDVDSKEYILKNGVKVMLDGDDNSYYINVNDDVVGSSNGSTKVTVYTLGDNVIFSRNADNIDESYLYIYTYYGSLQIYSFVDEDDGSFYLKNFEVTKDGINVTYSDITNDNTIKLRTVNDDGDVLYNKYSLCNNEYKSISGDTIVEKKYFLAYSDGDISGLDEKESTTLNDYVANNTIKCE